MPFFRATIEVVGETETEGEFCDLMSVLLTENGIYHSDNMLMDWAYSMQPKEIDVTEDLQGRENYFADGDLTKDKTE